MYYTYVAFVCYNNMKLDKYKKKTIYYNFLAIGTIHFIMTHMS